MFTWWEAGDCGQWGNGNVGGKDSDLMGPGKRKIEKVAS